MSGFRIMGLGLGLGLVAVEVVEFERAASALFGIVMCGV